MNWWETAPLADEPSAAPAPKKWWENAPLAKAERGVGERVDDFARGTVAGIPQGLASLAGTPAAIEDGLRWVSRKIKGQTPEEQDADLRKNAIGYTLKDSIPTRPDTETMMQAYKDNVGPLYQPKGVEGEIGHTLGTFLSASVLGPGGIGRNLLTNAAVPTLAAEGADRAARGTMLDEYRPQLRAGAAIVSSLGAGMALPSVRSDLDIVRRADPRIVGETASLAKQKLDAAGGIGAPATLDEVAAAATGGQTGLTGLNRSVTNAPRGRAVAAEFYNQRAPATRSIAEQYIDDLQGGAKPIPSSQAGRAVQEGAEDIITNERRAINASEGPFYEKALTKTVPVDDLKFLSQDRAFQEALQSVRKGVRGGPIQDLPANSVAVLHEVRKELSGLSGELVTKGRPDLARLYEPVEERLKQVIIKAAPEYGEALGIGSVLRQDALEPLKNSVVGKVAKQSDLANQAGTVFQNQNYSAPAETARLVGALAKDKPEVASALIAQHLRTAVDDAFAPVQGQGVNVMAGPKLRNAIANNESLKAGLDALPNGAVKRRGLENFLEVLEMHNYKPAMGSPTAFASRELSEMGQGGLKAMAADTLKTGVVGQLTAIPRRLGEYFETIRYGNTVEDVARLLTDQGRAGRVLEELAKINPSNPKAAMLAYRLTYMNKSGQLGRAGALGYRAAGTSSADSDQ